MLPAVTQHVLRNKLGAIKVLAETVAETSVDETLEYMLDIGNAVSEIETLLIAHRVITHEKDLHQ